MHGTEPILHDLAIVLGLAAVTTVLFQRLRQPVVLGYLLAGLIASPHVPIPLFADVGRIHTISELGVILLMFSLGLEFSIGRLASLGPKAGLTALFEVSAVAWLGYLTGRLLGWGTAESVFAGATVSISSTMIVAKAFSEGQVPRKLKELVFGVLVFEDLIAIVLLAALAAVATGQRLTGSELTATAASLGGFLVGVLVVGLLVVPRFMRTVVALRRSETLVVASIGLCFVLALVARWAGYSVALGAFLAGSLVAESGQGARVEHLIRPVRDMFAAVFFVSVGMLIEPAILWQHRGAITAFALAVAAGKIGGAAIGAFLTGHGVRTSVQAGMSLAQIGEFSFIIAGVAATAPAAKAAPLATLAVGVSTVTAFATPFLIRASTAAAAWVDRKLPHRLQTFVTLYGSWIEHLGAARERTPWSQARRLAALVAVDTACMAALGIACTVFRAPLERRVATWGAVPPSLAFTAVVAGAAVLAIPFAVGLVRTARTLGLELASMALPPTASGTLDLAAAPRRALVVTLQLGTLLLAGIPLLAVTQPVLPLLPSLAAASALGAVLGIVFWRRAADLEGHVQAGAHVVIEALKRQAGAGQAPPLDDVEQLLPGLGSLHAVAVGDGHAAVGRTLAELDLRGLTGATVLAIRHADQTVVLPSASATLVRGDVLAMAGSVEAIAAARVLLRDGPSQGEA